MTHRVDGPIENQRRTANQSLRGFLFGALLAAILPCSACHRQFYRQQADAEAYSLLDEKASSVARAPNVALRIEPDPRSRFFNPFDPDFQPRPVDDPASQQYMQCVDGKRGYPLWDAAGITNTAENPQWWQFLPLDENGVLTLNSENVVQIALLHSPEYQTQLENLYLSALDVSSQRFQFDTQFFSRGDAGFTFDGSRRSGVGASRTQLGTSFNQSLSRRLATGGNLLVGLANNIVWDLSGPNAGQQTANSLLDFSLIQPLLRNGGRDVVLEGLTQAERQLLADVRSFERFRRQFFINTTVGPGGNSGIVGLLQNQLQIRNTEENIARVSETVLIFEDNLIELLTTIPDQPDSFVSQRLNIAQLRSNVVSQQRALVLQQANFQRQVDVYLRTLGLPPYICVDIRDDFLDQFNLIRQELLKRRVEISTIRSRVGTANVAILDHREPAPADADGNAASRFEFTLAMDDFTLENLEILRKEVEPLIQLNRELIEEEIPRVRNDIRVLSEKLPKRKSANDRLQARFGEGGNRICDLLNLPNVDESLFDLTEVELLPNELAEGLDQLEERFEGFQERIETLSAKIETFIDKGKSIEGKELYDSVRADIILGSQDLLAEIAEDVLSLQLIQARARTESVLLAPVDMSQQQAFEIAIRNRRDYANAKAELVDQWRQIEVIADDLESDLDFNVNGSVVNVGNNPFKFRGDSGRLQVGISWDTPITRLLERNAYRATLIAYERAKRDFYNVEDSLWEDLRAELRQLDASRLTFELRRQELRIAAEQVQLNNDIRLLDDARGRGAGPSAARNQIEALTTLLNAQNGLLGTYVDYEVIRRTLDLDLGTMELTTEGFWIDPENLDPATLLELPGTDVIPGGCNSCCLPNRVDPQ